MRLKSVAGYFDSTIARDAYNPLVRLRCQLEPFDYVKIDGASVKRRVMSTEPGVTIPSRGVIDISGQRYLVGDSSPDHWNGEVIRSRYVLQGADVSAEITSVDKLLSDTAGNLAYASIEFNKYSTDERDNSDYHDQYHIYFGEAEAVPTGSVISIVEGAETKFYLVRNSHHTMAGLIDALSNEVESPVIGSATFNDKEYDPVTDTYVATPSTVRCVRVRWQDHFTYLTQGSTDYERGDMQLFVPMSVAPDAGDTVELVDGTWTVLSTLGEGTYWSLHVRRS